MSSSSSASAKFTNRLAEEKSPYLLQHAHNPVEWWPWGDEAIQKAKQENKLIFLSVGYSTCHWCHVMEKESFENGDIASVMNEHFVNIKVDREERPDIDKIYMTFLLMSKGSGGWPMSVWLTPELAPIAAGTYYPPTDKWGTPGFKRVLLAIAAKWETDKTALQETGQRVMEIIQQSVSEKQSDVVFEPGSVDQKLSEAISIFKRRYDKEFGGFGSHPKFPEVSRINFLFHAYIVTKDTEILDIAVNTLKKIGKGGIHDHVFGGFARYSVDRQWHVPHFEKMLYDQGQLMSSYANAYKLTKDHAHLVHAHRIFRYLMKDLRHPLGGFYAGEDADSLPTASDTVKVEGAFYAWEYNEIRDEIAENAELFPDFEDVFQVFDIYCYHYNLREGGNVDPASDPHGHLINKNIPIVKKSLKDTSDKFQIPEEKLMTLLDTVNEVLHKVRSKRPRPHLDTKIITAWNGLVLSGLAKLACCCDIEADKRDEYMKAASDLVEFLRKYSFDKDHNVLLRSVYGAENGLADIQSEKIHGFLDDYAFLIKGLLDYYKASMDFTALEWAKELQDIQNQHFWDDKFGAYFYSQANNPNVVVRLKEDHDGAEPTGNSVAARNLVLLSQYFDIAQYKTMADATFNFFADTDHFAYTLPEMMSGLLLNEHGLDLVAVIGPDSEDTRKFVNVCRKFYIPGMIIVHVDPHRPTKFQQRAKDKFKMLNDKTTVYICHNKVCRLPVTCPDKLEENLREAFLSHLL